MTTILIIPISTVGAATTFNNDIFSLVLTAGPVAKAVLFGLLIFSLISWGIILDKVIFFSRIRRSTTRFISIFRQLDSFEEIFVACTKLQYSPLNNIYQAGFREYKRIMTNEGIASSNTSSDRRLLLERELAGAIASELLYMEKRLSFLATTASATPFIGLFGTVWGIINSFRGIGSYGSASIAVVAPGIAEALIATAAGLAAAIPALIGFNYYVSQIKKEAVSMDRFANEFIALLEF